MKTTPLISQANIVFSIFILLLPALRPAFKYADGFSTFVFYVALAWGIWAVIWLLFIYDKSTILGFSAGIGIAVYTICALYFYPIADGLSASMNGYDQDDCVKLVSSEFFGFDNPLAQSSYYGNPCSTGMGIAIIFWPFVAAGLYQLAGPLLLLIFWLLGAKYRGIALSSAWTLVIMSLPLTLELVVNGSDFVVLGLGFAIVGIILDGWTRKPHLLGVMVTALLAGLLASGRISLLLLLPVLWIHILRLDKTRQILFILISLFVSIIPTFVVWLRWSSEQSQTHLLIKSTVLLPGLGLVAAAAICAVMFLIFVIFRRTLSAPRSMVLGFIPHLILLSLGDVVQRSYTLADWEGANYLMLAIPLLVVSFLDTRTSTTEKALGLK